LVSSHWSVNGNNSRCNIFGPVMRTKQQGINDIVSIVEWACVIRKKRRD
jgi:hypothetical protein